MDLTGPAQRKRKADQASLGEPPKRRKINVAVGQELPGRFAPTNISPRKRKAEEDEEEEEVVVVQTAPKKRKIVILGYRRAQPAASAPQTPASPAVSKGRPWSADEESATIKIMQDLVAEGRVYGDKRWAECAKRLKKQQPSYRSAAAIKNQWNRVLRARSGVDERKHPNPSRMTTGSQTPKKRKRAQSVVSATATAAEDDLEEGEEVEEDDEMEEEVKDADEDKDEGQDEETRKVKNDWGNEDFALPRKRMLRGGREY